MKKQIEEECCDMLLPEPITDLLAIFSELRSINNERLDQKIIQDNGNQQSEEIRGLKFISNKLSKLFDKNRRLQYNQVTKILIDNFASESNDERNIKRRVYDAINVLVSAGLFEKNGDYIEKSQKGQYRSAVKELKKKLDHSIKSKEQAIKAKRIEFQKINRRIKKQQALIERNKKIKTHESQRIYRPQIPLSVSDDLTTSFQKKESKNKNDLKGTIKFTQNLKNSRIRKSKIIKKQFIIHQQNEFLEHL